MKNVKITICLSIACVMTVANFASADIFGTGANQFSIDFVPISGSTNPTSGYGIVNNDYRMGKYAITVEQWQNAGFSGGYWSDNQPATEITWFQAAQFVNWLNIQSGHQIAYNFDGGTYNIWDESQAAGGTNLYRHKDAYYFLPTENEWVKAAYWNGTSIQVYATKSGETLHQGDGFSGTGWNYGGIIGQAWAVGSGSEELNSTYDMMGNVYEWMESTYLSEVYTPNSSRCTRGGMYGSVSGALRSSYSDAGIPAGWDKAIGFRVASIPEPATLLLLSLGGIVLRRRKK